MTSGTLQRYAILWVVLLGLVVGGVTWMVMRLGSNPMPAPRDEAATTRAAATSPATRAATADGVLVIAVEDAAAPWSEADGTGCANDIVRAAYEAVGVPVKLEVYPYARAKEMVMNGRVAACVAMSWSPELEGKVEFPDADKPLYVCVSTYVRSRMNPLEAADEESIPKGTRIGTVIDYEYSASIRGLKDRGVVLEAADSEETNLKKLALGRIDLAVINIDDLKTAELLFEKAGVKGQVEVVFTGQPQQAHIGFSKRHPQGEPARAKFNEGYEVIKKNGKLEGIYQKWRAR